MFLHRKMFGVFTPIHTGKKNCPMKKIFLIRVERSTKQNFFLFHKEFFFSCVECRGKNIFFCVELSEKENIYYHLVTQMKKYPHWQTLFTRFQIPFLKMDQQRKQILTGPSGLPCIGVLLCMPLYMWRDLSMFCFGLYIFIWVHLKLNILLKE